MDTEKIYEIQQSFMVKKLLAYYDKSDCLQQNKPKQKEDLRSEMIDTVLTGGSHQCNKAREY